MSIAAARAASGSWTQAARNSVASCTGQPATTNIAFGGDDWKTFYFTSRTYLGSVTVKIPGVPVPVPKKTTG
jgi:hypothetical protein